MGADFLEVSLNALKLIFFFLMMVQMVPLLVWLERRGAGFIQDRLGPNRVGPFGLTQLLADAVKFLMKEEFIPQKAVKFLFYGAPIFALIPASLALCAIPFGPKFEIPAFSFWGRHWGPYEFILQGYEVGVGIVFILAAASLAVYSILMAGWGSGNKYSLLGAIRASSQIISYELALGLTIVAVVLIYGTFSLNEMVTLQRGPLSFEFFGKMVTIDFLPNWGIFYQPIGAFLFLAASFAESNRLPFDLPEGEAELVAGFHTEYGGFKMNLFFIGEYGHMIVASALLITFYFGGYELPFLTSQELLAIYQEAFGVGLTSSLLNALTHFAVFMFKIFIVLWIFIHVRWTLPRFRYDQLMELGWKTMLPWALGNLLLTALIYVASKTY
ncbi:MAG: NADH-quinone oxidoreductase subunit H [Bdellovibrionaceae bacterium]|nr:NADH-quinone oxidoreductase subunit H [Pseudobdellovibrionaceae bacterium]MDW8189371.1 complex I subunit 1 family protein [Pseudobdellovibrionaceae bacterium]